MKKLALLSLLVLLGCAKKEIKRPTSDCMTEKITAFKSESLCDDATVKKYTFQGNVVYAFDHGTCGADLGIEVWDEWCNRIGMLNGITGNTKINGVEFSNATYLEMIWEK